MERSNKLTMGADVEVFLTRDKKIVPCVGLFKGTKEKPWQIPNAEKGFMLQEDNVMLEFNIPVTESATQFYINMEYGLDHARKQARGLGNGYDIAVKSSHKFTPDQLDSRQAQVIGCEPDNNAYEMGQERTNPPKPGLERTCGGHIHMGGKFNCPDFVAALFLEMSLASAGLIETGQDLSWYRQPGLYRSKPYGIEYRTVSNSIYNIEKASARNFYRRPIKYPSLYTTSRIVGLVGDWLIKSDADDILDVFKNINWKVVRNYILMQASREDFSNEVLKAQVRGYPA